MDGSSWEGPSPPKQSTRFAGGRAAAMPALCTARSRQWARFLAMGGQGLAGCCLNPLLLKTTTTPRLVSRPLPRASPRLASTRLPNVHRLSCSHSLEIPRPSPRLRPSPVLFSSLVPIPISRPGPSGRHNPSLSAVPLRSIRHPAARSCLDFNCLDPPSPVIHPRLC